MAITLTCWQLGAACYAACSLVLLVAFGRGLVQDFKDRTRWWEYPLLAVLAIGWPVSLTVGVLISDFIRRKRLERQDAKCRRGVR